MQRFRSNGIIQRTSVTRWLVVAEKGCSHSLGLPTRTRSTPISSPSAFGEMEKREIGNSNGRIERHRSIEHKQRGHFRLENN